MRKLSILLIMILVIVSLSAASAADSNHTGDILQAPADNDNLEIDEITDNLQTEDSNSKNLTLLSDETDKSGDLLGLADCAMKDNDENKPDSSSQNDGLSLLGTSDENSVLSAGSVVPTMTVDSDKSVIYYGENLTMTIVLKGPNGEDITVTDANPIKFHINDIPDPSDPYAHTHYQKGGNVTGTVFNIPSKLSQYNYTVKFTWDGDSTYSNVSQVFNFTVLSPKGTFSHLQDLIDHYDSYVFDLWATVGLFEYNETVDGDRFREGIVIDKDIFINGGTVSGKNSARIFKIINKANVEFDDIDLINGSADYGGAIYVGGNSTIKVLDYSMFENNTAAISGGAIYIEKGSSANVSGSFFKNNSAAFHLSSAIYNKGDLYLNLNVINGQIYENYNCSIYNEGNITSKVFVIISIDPDWYYDEFRQVHDMQHNRIRTPDDEFRFTISFYDGLGDQYREPNLIASPTTFKFHTIDHNDLDLYDWAMQYHNGSVKHFDYVAVYNETTGQYNCSMPWFFHDMLIDVRNSTLTIFENYTTMGGLDLKAIIMGTYTDLQYEIDIANPGDTITLPYDIAFNKDYESDQYNYVNQFPEGIIIDKNITIDGNGHEISGSDINRIFKIVNGSTVTLKNIEFTKGKADNGGAIYVEENSTVIISDSIFKSNNASLNGGAIYISNPANVSVMSSTFESNVASALGNSIYNEGNLSLSGNTIREARGIYDNRNISSDVHLISIEGDNIQTLRFEALDIRFNLTDDKGNGIISAQDIDLIYCMDGISKNVTVKAKYNDTDGYYHVKFTPEENGHMMLNSTSNTQYPNLNHDLVYINLIAVNATLNITPVSEFEHGENPVFIINLTGYNGIPIDANDSCPVTLTISQGANTITTIYDIRFNGTIRYTFDMLAQIWDVLRFGNYTATAYWNGIPGYYNETSAQCNFTVRRVKGTYTDLQYLIDNCNGVLDFEYNFAYNSSYDEDRFPNGVVVNKTLTINGNGFNISGENAYRIFYVEDGVNFTLNNVTLMKGKSSYTGSYYDGGAIYALNDNLKLDGVTFLNNEAYGMNGGGAIYIASQNFNLDVKDCWFENNTSNDGGAIFAKSKNTKMAFNGTTFIGNRVDGRDGGAILINDDMGLETVDITCLSCNFTGNIVSTYGGAIDINSPSVDSVSLVLSSCNFNDNYANNDAGAVCLNFNSAGNVNFNCSACNFNDNYANNGAGAVCLNFNSAGNVNFNCSACNFTNNSAQSCAGAVYLCLPEVTNDFVCEFSGSNFINNTVSNGYDHGGGAVCIDVGSIQNDIQVDFKDKCLFENNTAYIGGAIHVIGNGKALEVNINDTEFCNNSANGGSSIYVYSPNLQDLALNFNRVNFENNNATGSSGGAVGIYMSNSINNFVLNCNESNFTNNHAFSYGGAIFAQLPNVNEKVIATFAESQFTNNTALAGGAVYIDVGNADDLQLSFKGENNSSTNFVNNTAGESGGAVYITYGDVRNFALDLTQCNFEANRANNSDVYNPDVGNGGAMAIYSTSSPDYVAMTCSACNFTNNTASNYGGAISVNSYGASNEFLCEFDQSKFENNTAAYGGAIYIYSTYSNDDVAKVYVRGNSSFVNNTANSNGGAIFINIENFKLGFDDIAFAGNNASCGGAAYVSSRKVQFDVEDVEFYNNAVNQSGGALLVNVTDGSEAHVTVHGNCSFINNTADVNGGAVSILSNASTNEFFFKSDSDSCINFINNTAAEGGAIYIVASKDYYGSAVDATIDLTQCNFANNKANVSGGAAHIEVSNGNLISSYSNFTNNNANVSGGAIHIVHGDGQSSFNFRASEFANNTADVNGGAICIDEIASYSYGGSLEFNDGCSFENNTAGENGGAIFAYMSNADLAWRNINFTKNAAGCDGGAIYLNGTDGLKFDIDEMNFSNNTANGSGGVIFVNHMVGNGNNVELTVHPNCAFENNTADVNGGAIAVQTFDVPSTTITLENPKFSNSTAGVNGGVLFANATGSGGESLGLNIIGDSSFINNTALSGSGGAIFIEGNCLSDVGMSFEPSTQHYFVNNTAGLSGGAVFVNLTGYDNNWMDSFNLGLNGRFTFENNSAVGGFGGAIDIEGRYINGVNLNMDDSYDNYFTNNTAGASGGAIAVQVNNMDDSEISVKNSQFLNNSAGLSGGAVFVNATSNNGAGNLKLMVQDISEFINNTAGANGGAIAVETVMMASTEIDLNVKTFVNNTASLSGGAVFVNSTGDDGGSTVLKINSGCSFINNTAGVNGGAVGIEGRYLEDVGMDFESGYEYYFVNNTAGLSGGAVFVNLTGNDNYWMNSFNLGLNGRFTFENNSAVNGFGGAIDIEGNYINGINMNMADSSDNYFTNNTASASGGAIAVHSDNIANSEITIKNAKFLNNTASVNGGAVFVNATGDNGGELYVYVQEQSGFVNNTAGLNGGAIDIAGFKFKEVIVEITLQDDMQYSFMNNTAGASGGAIAVETAMAEKTELDLNVNMFVNNTAGASGGAVFVNSTGDYGGTTNLKINGGCSFINNTAGLNGGAVGIEGRYLENVGIDFESGYEYYFVNNTAGLSGGAVFVNLTGNDNYWMNSFNLGFNGKFTFENNSAVGGFGGAIDIEGSNIKSVNMNMADSSDNYFTNNTASASGGAIAVHSDNIANSEITIKNTKFMNNTADASGGAVFVNASDDGNGNLKVYVQEQSGFVNNTAGLNGGAIDIAGFKFNEVIMEINLQDDMQYSFMNNTAGASGGAIAVETAMAEKTELDLNVNMFVNNTAGASGGAVFVNATGGDAGSIVLKANGKCTFINNTAGLNGGAVGIEGRYLDDVGIDFESGNEYYFANNTAGLNGGAISVNLTGKESNFMDSFEFIIKQGFIFENNTAANGCGGAIDIEGSYIDGLNLGMSNYNDVYFTNNTAGANGGAIAVRGNNVAESSVNLNQGKFLNNTAVNGGAAYVNVTGKSAPVIKVEIIESYFANNTAVNGGAVAVQVDDLNEMTFVIGTSMLFNNTADENGGAIFVNLTGQDRESILFHIQSDAKFLNNSAGTDGGAIYLESDHMDYTNVEFDTNYDAFVNNTAGVDGGAVAIQTNYIGSSTSIVLKSGGFINNSAGADGGALSLKGEYKNPNSVSLSVTSANIIENNTAGANGGAIAVEATTVCGDVSITVENDFTNNTACADGGAVFVNLTHNYMEGNLELIASGIFVNNTAGASGGAIAVHDDYAKSATIGLSSSIFYNNTAGASGGAVFVNSTDADIELTGSMEFVNNTAGASGGAIAVQGEGSDLNNWSMVLDSKVFYNNTAGANGGAISVNLTGNGINEFSLETAGDCEFINNTADVDGGAIYLETKSVKSVQLTTGTNTYFTNSSAAANGGAIAVKSEGAYNVNLGLSENNFVNNTAAGGSGGAIFIDAIDGMSQASVSLNTERSLFENNTAHVDGGAIGVNATNCELSLELSSEFTNNSAGVDGGALAVKTNSNNGVLVYLIQATLNNNTAGIGGGAVDMKINDCKEALIDLSDTSLTNNTAGLNGGAVALQTAGDNEEVGVKLKSTKISNNAAVAGSGGAMFINTEGKGVYSININEDAVFENNTAGVNGGAISINSTGIESEIILKTSNDVLFKNNTAGVDGGAFSFNGTGLYGYFITLSAEFTNNSAGDCGGAVAICGVDTLEETRVSFDSSAFNNNSAGANGGAVSIQTANNQEEMFVNVQSTTFYNNTAGISGGAMFVDVKGDLDYSLDIFGNSVFANNTAGVDGGAVYYNSTLESDLSMEGSQFENNTAFRGGAMYLGNTRISAETTSFIKNKANSTNITYVHENENLTLTFSGYENYFNAIYAENCNNVLFRGDVAYWNGTVTTVGDSGAICSENETGINITLEIDGISKPIVLMTDRLGQINFSTLSLANGDYNFTAYHESDDYYTGIMTRGKFTVSHSTVDTNLTVSVGNIVYGQNATVNVTLRDVNGNNITNATVNVTIDGQIYEIEIKDGFGSRNISGLAAKDNYVVNATFKGNETYNSSNATDNFTVFKANSTVDIKVENVTYNATVSVNVTVVNATGVTYTLKYADGTIITENVTVDLTKNLTLALGAGNYTITVVNKNTTNITGSQASRNFTVRKAKSAVNSSDVVEVYGVNATVTISSVNATSVNVTVLDKDNNTVYSNVSALANGNVVLPVLAAGNYTIKLTTNPLNGNYSVGFNEYKLTIVKSNSSVVIGEIANVTYPDATVINFTVSNASDVNWTIVNKDTGESFNGTGLNNITEALPAGNYTVTIETNGNDNVTGYVASADFTVNKAASSIVISPIGNVTYPASTVINFTVVNDTVVNWTIVNKDTQEVINGSGLDNITEALPAGNYTVTIQTKGNDNVTGYVTSADFTVNKATSSIVISPIGNVTYPASTVINFTVVNDTVVNWTIVNKVTGDKINGSGLDNITRALAAGNYTITIENAGTVNVTGYVASADFTVNKVNSSVVISEINNVTYPDATVINFTVSNASDVNWTIVNKDTGDKVTGSGLNNITEALPAGNYTVTIETKGNDNVTGYVASADFTVNKAASRIVISPIGNVTYPASTVINFTVVNDTVVNWTIVNKVTGDKINGSGLNNITRALAAGNYTITIENAGTVNVTGYVASADFTVNKVNSSVVISEINNVTYPDATVINFTVVNASDVNWTIINKDTGDKVTGSGLNNITQVLPAGNYTVTIESKGNDNVTGFVTSADFTVSKAASNIVIAPIGNVTYPASTVINFTVVNDTVVNWTIVNKVTGDKINGSGLNNITRALAAGNYTIIIENVGTVNVTGYVASADFTVNKVNSSVVIDSIGNVTYPDATVINFTVVNASDVNWTIINKDTGDKVTGSGLNNITQVLPAGNYTVTIESKGNDNVTGFVTSADFTVSKAASNIVIAPIGNVTYPASTVINFTVVNDTVVNWTIVNKVTGDKINGSGLNNITRALAAGNYTITIENAGTVNVTGYVASADFSVNKVNSSVVIDSIGNVTYPDPVVINFTASNATEVNWTIVNKDTGESFNGTGLNNITQVLPAGNYTVTIESNGNDNVTGFVTSADFTVSKAASSIVIAPIGNVTYPDATVINFTVVNDTVVNWTIVNKVTGDKINGSGLDNITRALAAGNYTITIENAGTVNITGYVASADFSVNKVNSSVVIDSIGNVTYPDATVINFTVVNASDVNWTIVNKDTGESFNGTGLNNITQVLPAGNYTVTIESKGNDNVTGFVTSADFTVSKAASNIVIAPIGNVTYPASTVINFTVSNATVVNWTIVNKDTKESINGTGLDNITRALAAGNYTITIENAETVNITGYVASADFTVDKAVSSIVISPIGNVTYPDATVINFTVVNDTVVNWTIVNKVTGDKINGSGLNNITRALAAGNYTITIENAETVNITGYVASADFSVNKVNSSVVISEINNVTYPDPVVINFTVSNASDVNWTIVNKDTGESFNGTGLNNITQALPAGNYTVTIESKGNDNVTGFTTSADFTVNKAASIIVISPIGNVTYPASTVINFTVSNATVVNWTIVNKDTKESINGTGLDNITRALAAGNYTITIENAETVNITGYVASADFTVDKAVSNIVIAPIADVTYPASTVVNFTVSNATVVNWTIVNKDTKESINGTGLDNITRALAAGNYTITIENAETANITGSVASANFTVSKAPSSVSAGNVNVTYGDPITVHVSSENATNVTYEILDESGKSVANGTLAPGKNITGLKLDVGSYTVNLKTVVDDNHIEANYVSNITVSKISDYEMNVSSDSPHAGDNATVTVKVPENATGNVTVTLSNGTNYTGEIKDGVATVNVPDLPAGDNNVTVTYSGDDKYANKTSSATIHVQGIVIDANDMKRGWDSPYDYLAKVRYEDGAPVANRTVVFSVDGKQYNATTDDSGIAKLTDSKLDVGKYNVTVIFKDTGANVTREAEIVKRIVENKDLTMDYKDGHKFIVRAIGDDGNPVGKDVVVSIKINGKTYKVKTDDDGYAKLAINLIPKKYTATSTYHNYAVKNTVTVKQILKLVKKTVAVKKGKNIVLKATLKKSNGKPIKGKTIKFRFYGKTFKVKTNSKGLAKATVKDKKVLKKLKKGKKYNYSAAYVKDIVKGKVKIKK